MQRDGSIASVATAANGITWAQLFLGGGAANAWDGPTPFVAAAINKFTLAHCYFWGVLSVD